MSRPAGIPKDAVAFYADLEANNDREWWAANKERYETSVREPFTEVVDALADEFGEARIFRPYRDVRFSVDKTPYKTEQGAILGGSGSGVSGYYLRVGRDGLTTGGGYMHAARDQVARYREAVADDSAGVELQRIVDGLRRKRFQLGARSSTLGPGATTLTIRASSCSSTRASSSGATTGRRTGCTARPSSGTCATAGARSPTSTTGRTSTSGRPLPLRQSGRAAELRRRRLRTGAPGVPARPASRPWP